MITNREAEVFARLAQALQKFTTSASANVGSDCMLHAQMAQILLQEEGLPTRVVVGEAAWRIGPGDGDVITHSPSYGGCAPAGVKALAYHAWLESDTSAVIDFTTHSLRIKATQLDAMDGGRTTVTWCPDYLVLGRLRGMTIEDVAQAQSPGAVCYRELPGLFDFMAKNGLVNPPDVQDQQVLRFLFEQPQIKFVGANDLKRRFSGITINEEQAA